MVNDKLGGRIADELRKLPRRQDIDEVEHERLLMVFADDLSWWARIIHSGIKLAPAGTSTRLGREEREALHKAADALCRVWSELTFSKTSRSEPPPLHRALTGSGLAPEAVEALCLKLNEILGQILTAYNRTKGAGRGRPPNLLLQILVDRLGGTYSKLTGTERTRSRNTGGFLAFVGDMFKSLRIKDAPDHYVQKHCENWAESND